MTFCLDKIIGVLKTRIEFNLNSVKHLITASALAICPIRERGREREGVKTNLGEFVICETLLAGNIGQVLKSIHL